MIVNNKKGQNIDLFSKLIQRIVNLKQIIEKNPKKRNDNSEVLIFANRWTFALQNFSFNLSAQFRLCQTAA